MTHRSPTRTTLAELRYRPRPWRWWLRSLGYVPAWERELLRSFDPAALVTAYQQRAGWTTRYWVRERWGHHDGCYQQYSYCRALCSPAGGIQLLSVEVVDYQCRSAYVAYHELYLAGRLVARRRGQPLAAQHRTRRLLYWAAPQARARQEKLNVRLAVGYLATALKVEV